MVWFYRLGRWESGRIPVVFQSHYGLILSFIFLSFSYSTTTSLAFNPTMVWFYPKQDTELLKKLSRTFNPTMVWFYPIDYDFCFKVVVDLSIPLWSDFIRTVVFYDHVREFVFQSHYGLILSINTNYGADSSGCFQSHYGLILSLLVLWLLYLP